MPSCEPMRDVDVVDCSRVGELLARAACAASRPRRRSRSRAAPTARRRCALGRRRARRWIVVGQRRRHALAEPRRRAPRASRPRRLGDRPDERRVVDDAAQRAGQRGEPTGSDLDPDGVAHDVLELVRLVDDDDVVLGQQHAAAGDVQPVQVQVDDDDVGVHRARWRARSAKHGSPSGQRVAPGHSSRPTVTARTRRVASATSRARRGRRSSSSPAHAPSRLDLDLRGRGEVVDLELALRGGRLELAEALQADVVAATLQHGPLERPVEVLGRSPRNGRSFAASWSCSAFVAVATTTRLPASTAGTR